MRWYNGGEDDSHAGRQLTKGGCDMNWATFHKPLGAISNQ